MLKFLKRFRVQIVIGLTILMGMTICLVGVYALYNYHNSPFRTTKIKDYHIRTHDTIIIPNPYVWSQDWVQTQPPRKTHHFRVHNRTDIPKILSLAGINNIQVRYDDPPGFNSCDGEILYWYFKDPEPHLLNAYFQPRVNPFKLQFPHADHQYTLNDLLHSQYDPMIAENFIFWDTDKIFIDEKVEIIPVIIDIPFGGDPSQAINDWLLNQHIISTPKLINPRCYNMSENHGLVLPLPLGTYQNQIIDAVYFDKGIRVLDDNPKYSLDNLLKLANGAEKVYLFTLNKLPKPEPKPEPKLVPPLAIKIINIPVADHTEIGPILKDQYGIEIGGVSSTPSYNKFREKSLDFWLNKPDSDLVGVYLKPRAEFYGDTYIYNIGHTLNDLLQFSNCIETAYIFRYDQDKIAIKKYQQALEQWQNNCIFKRGISVTGDWIRSSVYLGRNDLILYGLGRGEIVVSRHYKRNSPSKKINIANDTNYKLRYKYNLLPREDDWFFAEEFDSKSGAWIGSTNNYPTITFNTYLSKTPPPTRPSCVSDELAKELNARTFF